MLLYVGLDDSSPRFVAKTQLRASAKKGARSCPLSGRPLSGRLRRADAGAIPKVDVDTSLCSGFGVPDIAGTVLCRRGVCSARPSTNGHNKRALGIVKGANRAAKKHALGLFGARKSAGRVAIESDRGGYPQSVCS